jgi:charged multivesicular body protein 7
LHRQRLAALYSDFSHLHATNPDGYTANIEAWLKALAHASRAGLLPSSSLLSLTIDDSLLRDLETKEWGRPLALPTVIQEGIRRKQFIPVKEYMEAKESIYHNPWSLNPLHFLGWGLRQLGVLGPAGGRIKNGQFIVLQNLEDTVKEFGRRTEDKRSQTERVWTRDAFESEFRGLLGEKGLTESDFPILLRFLDRDKGLITQDSSTIKLRTAGEEKGIINEDTTIASLKSLISDLEPQIKILESRIESFTLAAKEAVVRKSKVSALAALRSKKLAETTLEKRHATLAQLEEVYSKIEQAHDQVELVRIMEGSARVLEGLNKQVGGVERVDGIVDKLREQMGEVDEVGNVIFEVGKEGVDEGEVDEEFEAMEAEERKKEEERERAAREAKEKAEAEETRKKLAELERMETEAKEKAAREQEEKEKGDKALEDSTEALQKMSLEPPTTA